MTGTALADRDASPGAGPVTAVYGIVGGSDRHSLAPAIFNTAFRELGMAAEYLPFYPADFRAFWRERVDPAPDRDPGPPVRGLTVVSPHKEAALAVATTTGGRATRAGAANCLVACPAGWHAANTSGLIDLLAMIGLAPRRRRVAVIGCGGAGRSIATELSARAADVTLVNRGVPRARLASRLLELPWRPLREFSAAGFDIVVNATPLARELPFDPTELSPGSVVADLAYIDGARTALVDAARDNDLVAIDGREVLAAETGAQFRLMTGRRLPAAAVRVAHG